MKFFIKNILIILLSLTLFTSCAIAPRKRFLIGAAIGGTGGAVSGAVLSPNAESRTLNALVFGLVGTLLGGLTALLIHDDSEVPESKASSQNASNANAKNSGREFDVVPSTQELPPFVKERLKTIVVEELEEPDSVTEDGSLHEPHKVYRIKRQAELIAKPVADTEVKK